MYIVRTMYNVHTLFKPRYEQDIHRFRGIVSLILRAILQTKMAISYSQRYP